MFGNVSDSSIQQFALYKALTHIYDEPGSQTEREIIEQRARAKRPAKTRRSLVRTVVDALRSRGGRPAGRMRPAESTHV